MFTGIVTDIGEIAAIELWAEGLRRMTISCHYDPAGIVLGASICCSGVCMTVVEIGKDPAGRTFSVDAAAETLAVTTVGRWRIGTRVNLERALRVGDELGGHLVSGHVDGIAAVLSREDLTDMARLAFAAPPGLARFIAQKGSVALDGVSLTVNAVDAENFSVLIIPHTLSVTTFDALRTGDAVNLEVDTLARYAARLIEMRG
jgi:riboflavin synthase